MPANKLGCRMYDYVGTKIHRPTQIGCRKSGVDYQGQSGIVGNRGDGLDVVSVFYVIPDGRGLQCLGMCSDRLAQIFRVVAVDKLRIDAVFSKGNVKLGIGPAI